MAAIFISHSSRDSKLAGELKCWLESEGYESIFMDLDTESGLQVGEHWEQRLYREIGRCHAVMLALTPNWLASKWCFAEFTQARALGKTIFPIILSPMDGKRIAAEIQGIDLRDWDEGGKDQLRRRMREITKEYAFALEWDRLRAPFPGINSFEREDAAVYFGRDEHIRELMELLEARRIQGGMKLLLIVGASGSGKSSLLKAGIIPQLKHAEGHWIVIPSFRPLTDPISELGKSIAEITGDTAAWRGWRDRLNGTDAAAVVRSLTEDLCIGPARGATIVIPIDQFEEIFTMACTEERERFLSLLNLIAAPDTGLPVIIVATVRSDLLGEVLQANRFTIPFDDYALRPIPMDRVERIIEGPAAVAALALEKGFARRVASDISNTEALPLLAFVLRELYDRRSDSHELTISDYEGLGNVHEGLNPLEYAVRRKAEDVFNQCQPSASETEDLKIAFLRGLVKVGDDGRVVRKIAKTTDLPSGTRPLLEAMVQARLLSKRRSESPQMESVSETYLEVSHEALFNAWPLLAGWLNDEKDFLVGKARLGQAVDEWSSANEDAKSQTLLHGLQLRRARQWLATYPQALSDEERDFIRASYKQETRQHWLHWSLVIITFSVLATVIFLWAHAYVVERNALECDRLAVETDNNVSLPGIEIDKINAAEAIPACQKAVIEDPLNPRLIHNLARSLDRAGLYEDAAARYREAADLGFAWSMNNLGVLYLSNKGVPFNLQKGVVLLRTASEQGNRQAMVNYAETDYLSAFEDDPKTVTLIEEALVAKGLLPSQAVDGLLGPAEKAAIEAFKRDLKLPDKGISLRVLDRIGVINAIDKTE